MKANQMKFIRNNEKDDLKHVGSSVLINMNDISPIGHNIVGWSEKDKPMINFKELIDKGHVLPLNIPNNLTIDIKEIKSNFRKVWDDWFPFRNKTAVYSVGILWTAFMTYIFPWLLDVAKVYCCFQIAMGFYKENKGMTGNGQRGGFQSIFYWGKWLIAIHLVPVGVDLLDAIGAHMMNDIKTNPTLQFKQ